MKESPTKVVLFILGIIMVLYQPIMIYVIKPIIIQNSYKNNLTVEDIEKNIEEIKNRGYDERELEELFDYGSIDSIDALEIRKTFNKSNVIGVVYVPNVSMAMPIMYGITRETLRNSAGTMKPNQEMGKGNYCLAGHNSRNRKSLFAPVHRIKEGDTIYLTDKKIVYEYTATINTVIEPTDIYEINDTDEPTITLITCTNNSKRRVMVRGELVRTYNYEEADREVIETVGKI